VDGTIDVGHADIRVLELIGHGVIHDVRSLRDQVTVTMTVTMIVDGA